MSTSFDPFHHLIAVEVYLHGPKGDTHARLALDTGATYSFISKEILRVIGYPANTLPKTMTFTTGSGVESAARVTVDRFEALGQERSNFSVIAYTLPPTALIDGLLGLDFLRNHILTLNFQNGKIILD